VRWNNSWPARPKSSFGPRMSGTCDEVFVSGVQRRLCKEGVSAGGICPGASMGCGFSGGLAWRHLSSRGGRCSGGFNPQRHCLHGGGTLMCLRHKILAKLGNPRPSCRDLTDYSWLPSAILDSRKNNSTHWGTPFSTYTPNSPRISWSVPISTRVLLWDLPMCDHIKFHPNDTQTDDSSKCSINKA